MWYNVILVIGVVLFLWSLIMIKDTLSFLKQAERAKATVVRIKEEKDSDGTNYKPVFSYPAAEEQESFYEPYFYSSPSTWSVGDVATILFIPGKPQTARLATYFGIIGWRMVLMAF